MKDEKNQFELKAEWSRRSKNYITFDKLLTKSHGGDLLEMYSWVMTDMKLQFKIKYEHDEFVTDFHNWMHNRKISIHE